MAAVNREQLIQSAEKNVARGKLDVAIKEYERILEESPRDASTLNRIGDLWLRLNKVEEAKRVFARTAYVYIEDGFFVKAIAMYKKIIKCDPTGIDAYERLADLYHRQGLVNEARTQYQVLADYHQKHGNSTAAAAMLERLVELEPGTPAHRARLAELYQQMGAIDRSLAERRAIADLLLESAHEDEAVKVLMTAFALRPDDIEMVAELVQSLRARGYVGPAARFLAQVVERNPAAHEVVLRRLGGASQLAGLPLSAATTSSTRNAALSGSFKHLQPAPAAPVAPVAPKPPIAPAPAAPSARFDVAAPSIETGAWQTPKPATSVGPQASVAPAHLAGGPAPTPPAAPPPAAPAAGPVAAPLPAAEPPKQKLRVTEDPPPTKPKRSKAWTGEFPPPDVTFSFDAISVDTPAPEAAAPPVPAARTPPTAPIAATPPTPPTPPIAPVAQPPVAATFAVDGADDFAEIEIEIEGHAEADGTNWRDLAEPPLETSLTPPPATRERDIASVSNAVPPAPTLVGGMDLGGASAAADEIAAAGTKAPPRVEEQVAEAEVLAKYGLVARAVEKLRDILKRDPAHVDAYRALLSIYLEQGRKDRVAEVANQWLSQAPQSIAGSAWREARVRLDAEGFRVEGRTVLPPAVGGTDTGTRKPSVDSLLRELVPGKPAEKPKLATPPAPTPAPAAPAPAASAAPASSPVQRPALAPRAPREDSFADLSDFGDLTPPTAVAPPRAAEPSAIQQPAPAPPPVVVEPPLQAAPAAPMPPMPPAPPAGSPAKKRKPVLADLDLDDLNATLDVRPSRRAPPARATPPPQPAAQELFTTPPALEASFDEPVIDVLPPTAVFSAGFPPPAEPPPAAPPPASQPGAVISGSAPIVGRSSEPLHTADWLDLGDLASPWTEIPEVRARTGMGEALSPISGLDQVAPQPVLKSTAQDLFEDTAISWLEEEAKPQRGAAEQALFDDESEFFDLAAELEQELATENARRAGEEPEAREQTLEEIVESFKKGVAENLAAEDYDTHFNLGIAYREMGLVDEAIGEFQLAAKAPEHFLDCCSLLGLCFLEKGLPELAVKWYRRALETPALSEDQQLALQYELANALSVAGEREAAYKAFIDIYGSNSHFRDVVMRIAELKPA